MAPSPPLGCDVIYGRPPRLDIIFANQFKYSRRDTDFHVQMLFLYK